jgi:hypothetical protein
VRGERFRGANGVYFNELELTTKGDQAAIRQRTTVKDIKEAVDEAASMANALLPEIKKPDGE